MSKKLTPWFPPEIKPVRKGVYEIGEPFKPPWYRLWDGELWHPGNVTVKGAMNEGLWPKTTKDHQWRGLARKPK